MNVKTKRTKKQVNIENQAINLLSKEELNKKIEVVVCELPVIFPPKEKRTK